MPTKEVINKSYKIAVKRFLKNALYVGVPSNDYVSKNKITVIWQDKDESVYTWQIYANTYQKNLKKIAISMHRIICKKYNKKYEKLTI